MRGAHTVCYSGPLAFHVMVLGLWGLSQQRGAWGGSGAAGLAALLWAGAGLLVGCRVGGMHCSAGPAAAPGDGARFWALRH